jgi:hypothetical protein
MYLLYSKMSGSAMGDEKKDMKEYEVGGVDSW